jgi:hypothetical protein
MKAELRDASVSKHCVQVIDQSRSNSVWSVGAAATYGASFPEVVPPGRDLVAGAEPQ